MHGDRQEPSRQMTGGGGSPSLYGASYGVLDTKSTTLRYHVSLTSQLVHLWASSVPLAWGQGFQSTQTHSWEGEKGPIHPGHVRKRI